MFSSTLLIKSHDVCTGGKGPHPGKNIIRQTSICIHCVFVYDTVEGKQACTSVCRSVSNRARHEATADLHIVVGIAMWLSMYISVPNKDFQ